MSRLSTLFVLFISLVFCFLDAAVAAPKSSCSSSVSAVPTSRPSASSSSAAASQSASSSRRQPSGTASASSSRLSPSGTASASSSRLQSSGRPSSTRQSPSGTASQSQTTNSDGCPLYSTTTRTKTITVGGPPETTTVTSPTEVVYASTSYYSADKFIIITEYDKPTTSTITSISFVYDDTAVSTTISVPAPPGFTPVSCVAGYFDPTVTLTVTATQTFAETVYATTVTTTGVVIGPSYTTTSTLYSTVTTEFVTTTSTSTITRAGPTLTEYAACASNNVAFDGPSDSFLSIPQPLAGVQIGTGFSANDPAECCIQCLNDPSCVLGSGVTQAGGGGVTCVSLTKTSAANATCDASFQAAEMYTTFAPLLPIFISNSGCGQYVFK